MFPYDWYFPCGSPREAFHQKFCNLNSIKGTDYSIERPNLACLLKSFGALFQRRYFACVLAAIMVLSSFTRFVWANIKPNGQSPSKGYITREVTPRRVWFCTEIEWSYWVVKPFFNNNFASVYGWATYIVAILAPNQLTWMWPKAITMEQVRIDQFNYPLGWTFSA